MIFSSITGRLGIFENLILNGQPVTGNLPTWEPVPVVAPVIPTIDVSGNSTFTPTANGVAISQTAPGLPASTATESSFEVEATFQAVYCRVNKATPDDDTSGYITFTDNNADWYTAGGAQAGLFFGWNSQDNQFDLGIYMQPSDFSFNYGLNVTYPDITDKEICVSFALNGLVATINVFIAEPGDDANSPPKFQLQQALTAQEAADLAASITRWMTVQYDPDPAASIENLATPSIVYVAEPLWETNMGIDPASYPADDGAYRVINTPSPIDSDAGLLVDGSVAVFESNQLVTRTASAKASDTIAGDRTFEGAVEFDQTPRVQGAKVATLGESYFVNIEDASQNFVPSSYINIVDRSTDKQAQGGAVYLPNLQIEGVNAGLIHYSTAVLPQNAENFDVLAYGWWRAGSISMVGGVATVTVETGEQNFEVGDQWRAYDVETSPGNFFDLDGTVTSSSGTQVVVNTSWGGADFSSLNSYPILVKNDSNSDSLIFKGDNTFGGTPEAGWFRPKYNSSYMLAARFGAWYIQANETDLGIGVKTVLSTTYTLEPTDIGLEILFTGLSGTVVTVPTDLDTGDASSRFNCLLVDKTGGAGVVVQAATGATVTNVDGHTELSGQSAVAAILPDSAPDNYILAGQTK